MLEQLCNLPFSFFNDKIKRKILLSCLFSICYQNSENIKILHDLDMDIDVITQEIYKYREEIDIFRFMEDEFWADSV